MNPHDTYSQPALRILRVDSSGRTRGSVTRQLADLLLNELEQAHAGPVQVSRRDVSTGLPLVNEAWIQANFTDPDQRDAEQQAALALSDHLVAELMAADQLVLGVPIYNFGIPAGLKAWVDMIARARLTFRYTENGPEGLLTGKKAWLIVASGGTPVDSRMDFATPYLRHALAFIGITDVEVIAAERLMSQGEAGLHAARRQMAERLGRPSAGLAAAA